MKADDRGNSESGREKSGVDGFYLLYKLVYILFGATIKVTGQFTMTQWAAYRCNNTTIWPAANWPHHK